MKICQQNLLHAKELQKQAYNKDVKLCNYALGEKVWLNSQYIKTKQNQKLEAKFFRSFQVFHLVSKQTYKLKLTTKWRIHVIFYVLLLEQDITKIKQVDKYLELELNGSKDKKYEIEEFRNIPYITRL